MVRRSGFACDAELVAVSHGQECIETRITCRQLAAVREADDRHGAPSPGAQLEQPVQSAQSPGRLAASNPSLGIRDCVQAVSIKTPPLKDRIWEPLAQE